MKQPEPNWGQMILEQKGSGETIDDFCLSRGINKYTFKKRKYAVVDKPKDRSGDNFIEIPRRAGVLTVRLTSGRVLEVSGGFNDAEVQRFIRLLESC